MLVDKYDFNFNYFARINVGNKSCANEIKMQSHQITKGLRVCHSVLGQ